jgi:hypothetical protein
LGPVSILSTSLGQRHRNLIFIEQTFRLLLSSAVMGILGATCGPAFCPQQKKINCKSANTV